MAIEKAARKSEASFRALQHSSLAVHEFCTANEERCRRGYGLCLWTFFTRPFLPRMCVQAGHETNIYTELAYSKQ